MKNLGASPQLAYWSTGMMGELVVKKVKERKNINMTFCALAAHHSNILWPRPDLQGRSCTGFAYKILQQ